MKSRLRETRLRSRLTTTISSFMFQILRSDLSASGNRHRCISTGILWRTSSLSEIAIGERGVTMTKGITLQELQEHFADLFDEVRHGITLRLIDGGNVVAKISPADAKPRETKTSETPEDMIYRRAVGSFADFVLP